MVKVILVKSPSCCDLVPAVPGSMDMSKGRVICQHSIYDGPFMALIAVMLKCVGVWAVAIEMAHLRRKRRLAMELVLVRAKVAMSRNLICWRYD
jgi:hypothetical protein